MNATLFVKVGDTLIDNDPRMWGRRLTITEILPNGVAAKDSTGRVRIYLARRLHADGKKRRSGLSLESKP